MADKSYIELKLDPDKMKEELRGIIPGYRALEYFHNNPDSSFTNTLDLLAEDVIPFYAAYKYGAEPEDYIKEAFLLSNPVKAPTTAKNALAKVFKPGTKFAMSTDNYEDRRILAKPPKAKKYIEFRIDEDGSLLESYRGPAKEFNNIIEDKPTDINGLFKSIDNTNAAFEKLPRQRLKNPTQLANDDIGVPLGYSDSYSYTRGWGGRYNSLGNKIEEYNNIRRMLEEASNIKLGKGESIKVLIDKEGRMDPTIVKVDPPNNFYTEVDGYSDYWKEIPDYAVLRELPDKNLFDADYKALQNDINVRNTRADFEDDVIPYIDFEQYKDQYNKAFNEYSDALYGPFLEDVIPNYRRFKR